MNLLVSPVCDSRGGKNKTGELEDDLENVPPINQSVAMAIAGNPFNTLGRNVLVSMASLVKYSLLTLFHFPKKFKDNRKILQGFKSSEVH